MDQVNARLRMQSTISKQLRLCSMKRRTLGSLTGANKQEISDWVSGQAVPDYKAFLRLNEIFGLKEGQLAGRSFRDERTYNAFFCIWSQSAAVPAAAEWNGLSKDMRGQISRFIDPSDEISRSKRRNGGSRRKGRDVGVLSKANGYRP